MIIGFTGAIRSGKTLLMTVVGKRHQSGGLKIISNYNLSYPHKPLSVKDIEDSIKGKDTDPFANSCLLIDEIHTWADSRLAISKRNRFLSYLITQSGKLSSYIYWTSQYLGQVDKRLRQNTGILFRCSRYGNDGNNNYTVPLMPDDKTTDFIIVAQKLTQREVDGRMFWIPCGTIILNKPQKYFKLFDTKERIYYAEPDK